MESLYGYIGLSSRIADADAGLYVDALPDISIQIVTKITEQDEDINELWEVIEKRSILKFRTLFLNALNKCYAVKSIETAECLIEENKEVLATALWFFMGAEVMFERMSTSRLNRYTTIEKGKARELREAYMEVFNDELTAGVNSIDIHESDCFDSCPQQTNIISTHYVRL